MRSPNETTGRNDFSKIIVKSRSSLCGINLSATIWNVIATNSYTSVFFKFPLMLAVLTMSLYACALGIVFDLMLFTPIAVASIVYLLVNQRKLLFLGEAERYLNHIVVIIIVCAIDLANQLNVAWVVMGDHCIRRFYWIVESFVLTKILSSRESKGGRGNRTVFKRLQTDLLAASFPYHNYCLYRVMLLSEHNVIIPVHMTTAVRQQFVERFVQRYAYFDLTNLGRDVGATGLSTIILDIKALENRGLADWRPSSEWKEKIYRNLYTACMSARRTDYS